MTRILCRNHEAKTNIYMQWLLKLPKIQLCVKIWRVGGGVFFSRRFSKRKGCLTKHAPDAGALRVPPASRQAVFYALSFFRSDGVPPPAHLYPEGA